MNPRRIFVTTALPYANGTFHIGHIMEYIQADILRGRRGHLHAMSTDPAEPHIIAHLCAAVWTEHRLLPSDSWVTPWDLCETYFSV